MTDSDYAMCTEIAVGRSFTSWARDTLLEAVQAAHNRKGTVPGGACFRSDCTRGGAWFFYKQRHEYLCEECARPFRENYPNTIEDRRPACLTNEVLLGTVEQLLGALAIRGGTSALLRVCRLLVEAILVAHERELSAVTAALAPTSSPPPPPQASEPPGAPGARGLFDLLSRPS